jgi:hypothetical protein
MRSERIRWASGSWNELGFSFKSDNIFKTLSKRVMCSDYISLEDPSYCYLKSYGSRRSVGRLLKERLVVLITRSIVLMISKNSSNYTTGFLRATAAHFLSSISSRALCSIIYVVACRSISCMSV